MGVMSALPPLPTWPGSVCPHEPAHGFFRRLADVNGQSSIRPFAAAHGLNGRDLNLSETLEFCSRFPVEGVDDLRRNTPIVRGHLVEILHETLRYPRDWSATNPRVCSGCLHESQHVRNWFDINVLRHCPIHGCELVGDTLWHPQIGMDARTGEEVAAKMPMVAAPANIERYVLGRLGAMVPWHLPHLDDVALFHIIDAAEVLGYAQLRGWSEKAPQRRKKHSRSFREAVAVGFDVLALGAEVECLQDYAAGSPIVPVPGRINYMFNGYWGWLREAINKLEVSCISARLKRLLPELAAMKGIFSRKGGAEFRRQVGLKGLHELSADLHISHSSLRAVAVKLGITDASSRRAQAHCFDRAAVAQLKSLLDDLVSRKEAAGLVDLSLAGFEDFCFRHKLQPFIRLNGSSPSADQFRRSELAAAVSA